MRLDLANEVRVNTRQNMWLSLVYSLAAAFTVSCQLFPTLPTTLPIPSFAVQAHNPVALWRQLLLSPVPCEQRSDSNRWSDPRKSRYILENTYEACVMQSLRAD